MSNNTADAGIPVLTEIIPAAPIESSIVAAEAVVSAEQDEPAAVAKSLPLPALDAEQWEQLEREIRERVLVQVMERIDFVLEQRVRDSLADALQTAVDGLAADLRKGLQHSIKDVVTRALTQEITKLQATKK